jgi:hypothetical protein
MIFRPRKDFTMLAIMLAAASVASARPLETGWICHFTNQVRETHRSDTLEKLVRHGSYFDGDLQKFRIAYEDDKAVVMTWAEPWEDGGVHSETIAIAKAKNWGTEAFTDTSRPESAMFAQGECRPF